MDDRSNPETPGPTHGEPPPKDSPRVGRSDAEGDGPSGPGPGPQVAGAPGSDLQGGNGEVPQEDGDHLRERHPERVPRPEHVEAFREKVTQAFQAGDPEAAWIAVQALLTWTDEITADAAKSRFQLNFGTERCQNCTGLKAGPDVVATCYQVKLCYYTNFRGDGLTPRQARIANLLGNKS